MDRQDSDDDASTNSLPVDCSCSTNDVHSSAEDKASFHINMTHSPGTPPSINTSMAALQPGTPPGVNTSMAPLQSMTTNVIGPSMSTLDRSPGKRPYPDATEQETACNNDSSLSMQSDAKRLRTDPLPPTTEVGN